MVIDEKFRGAQNQASVFFKDLQVIPVCINVWEPLVQVNCFVINCNEFGDTYWTLCASHFYLLTSSYLIRQWKQMEKFLKIPSQYLPLCLAFPHALQNDYPSASKACYSILMPSNPFTSTISSTSRH